MNEQELLKKIENLTTLLKSSVTREEKILHVKMFAATLTEDEMKKVNQAAGKALEMKYQKSQN